MGRKPHDTRGYWAEWMLSAKGTPFQAQVKPFAGRDPNDAKAVAAFWRGASVRRPGQRGPQKAPTKQQVTLRLDRELLAHLRRGGRGWQTRLNDTLKRLVSRGYGRRRVLSAQDPGAPLRPQRRIASVPADTDVLIRRLRGYRQASRSLDELPEIGTLIFP